MPADIKEVLRRVLDEIENEERNDLLTELKDKKLTSKELVEAIRGLPDDERAAVRDAFLEVSAQTGGEKGAAKQLEKDAEDEEENRGVEGEERKEEPLEEKKKKTRPGRKNGRAYGWYIDERGKVKVTSVAQVYSGEDEPDEVEMYPDEEESDEDNGGETEDS
jgi:hypothetical protein